MGKEIQRWDEHSLVRMRNRELLTARRQRTGLFWLAGVCLVLSIAAIVVISVDGKEMAWLTNILLALSPVWIVAGLVGLISGFIGLMMLGEVQVAEEAVAQAAEMERTGFWS